MNTRRGGLQYPLLGWILNSKAYIGMSRWDNGLKSDIFFVQARYQMVGGHGCLLKEFVFVGIRLLKYKEVTEF